MTKDVDGGNGDPVFALLSRACEALSELAVLPLWQWSDVR